MIEILLLRGLCCRGASRGYALQPGRRRWGAEHTSVWQPAHRGSKASYPALNAVTSLIQHDETDAVSEFRTLATASILLVRGAGFARCSGRRLPLPVYPDNQTISEAVWTSHS